MKRSLFATLGLVAAVISCGDDPIAPPKPQPFTVSGTVTYCGSDNSEATPAIAEVVLTLHSADTTITATTGRSGEYSFGSVPTGQYSLVAARELRADDGLALGNSTDAAAIGLHVMATTDSVCFGLPLQECILSNACQLEAADFDEDGAITDADKDALRYWNVTGDSTRWGWAPKWRFSEYAFPISSDTIANFTGLLLGDVNLSWPWVPPPPPPPPPPDAVALTVFSVDDWKVALTWTQSWDRHFWKYEMFRNSEMLFDATGRELVAWNDTTVEPETEYRYQIFVVNPGGRAGSNIVTVTTPPPDPPSQP